MIEIDRTLISRDLLEKKFVCDLQACKGACCVEGDQGAPLLESELTVLKASYPKVKPFMRKEGIQAVEEQGEYVIDDLDGEWVTPLVDGQECAYVTFDDRGITKCAIEQAYHAGDIDFRKPVSCHLYPIRIKEYERYDALNYDEWSICKSACSCGEKLDVPVYRFAREALVRKYGEEWFEQLEAAAEVAKRL